MLSKPVDSTNNTARATRANRCVATSPRRTCASSCSSTMRRRSSLHPSASDGMNNRGPQNSKRHRHAARSAFQYIHWMLYPELLRERSSKVHDRQGFCVGEHARCTRRQIASVPMPGVIPNPKRYEGEFPIWTPPWWVSATTHERTFLQRRSDTLNLGAGL